jgi:spore maturation protein CgeB
MLTGRSFESIFAGGCLIQERVDDLDYYFEPGRHYYRFESFTDLRNLLTWLSHHPDEAQATAERGQAYYHAHYSDRAIVESLGRRLFPGE